MWILTYEKHSVQVTIYILNKQYRNAVLGLDHRPGTQFNPLLLVLQQPWLQESPCHMSWKAPLVEHLLFLVRPMGMFWEENKHTQYLPTV